MLRRHQISYHKVSGTNSNACADSIVRGTELLPQQSTVSQQSEKKNATQADVPLEPLSSPHPPSEPAPEPRAMSVFGDSVADDVAYDDDVWWLLRPNEETVFASPPDVIYPLTCAVPVSTTSDTSSPLAMAAGNERYSSASKWDAASRNIASNVFGVESYLNITIPSVNMDFFAPTVLQYHLELYFTNYHDQFPILHKPTCFDAPDRVNPLLLISIVTLGTSFSKEYFPSSVEIHRLLRGRILGHRQLTEAPLWLLQTLLLSEALQKMLGPRDLHELSATFHGAVVTLLRRCQLSALDSEFFDGSKEQIWKKWIEFESTRRLVSLGFIMDSQHAVIFGYQMSMSVNEIQITLPCPDHVWDCSSADIWWKIYGKYNSREPFFLYSLKELVQQRRVPAKTSQFSRLLLLHGLLSISWQIQENEVVTGGISMLVGSTGNGPREAHSSSDWREILVKAIETWHFGLPLNNGLEGESCKVLHSFAYVALYLNHLSVVDILVYSGYPSLDGRALVSRDHRRAQKNVQNWVTHQVDALQCVKNALSFLQETMFSWQPRVEEGIETGNTSSCTLYSAASDNVALRQWCIFLCIVILMSYCKASEHEKVKLIQVAHSPPVADAWSSCEQYIIHTIHKITKWLESDRGTPIAIADSTCLCSLRMLSSEALKGARWELISMASDCLKSGQ